MKTNTKKTKPLNNETEARPDCAANMAGKSQELSHHEVAALAQSIYEDEGCPEGCAEAHWHEAERRLREQSAGVVMAGPRGRERASA